MPSDQYKWPILIIVAIIVVLVAYGALTMDDRRTAADKISDAIDVLPQGADKAAKQLENRTPAQKLGDAIGNASTKSEGDARP